MGEAGPYQPHRARFSPARADGDDSTHLVGSAVNAKLIREPDQGPGPDVRERVAAVPKDLDLHLVLENYASHKTPPL
jgi:hypothetical protein